MNVAVGDCAGNFLAEWQRLGIMDQALSPYEGCTSATCTWVLQTRAHHETGNVAGYNSGGGTDVTYSDGKFAVSTNGEVSLTIQNGVATDKNGNQFDTSNGEWLRYETPTASESTTVIESGTATSDTTTATVDPLATTTALSTTTVSSAPPVTTMTLEVVAAAVRRVAEVVAQTMAKVAEFQMLLGRLRSSG